MRYIPSVSFFKFIHDTFGTLPVKLLKEWKKHRVNIYKCKLRIRFIKFCIQHEITPSHLSGLQRFNVHLRDQRLLAKFNGIKISIEKRLLKIELNDAYRSINYFRNCLFRLARDIMKNLPLKIANNFFDYQERNLFTFFIRERNRIDKKCDWLIHRRNSFVSNNIKPVKYYWSSCDSTSSSFDTSFSHINNNKFSLSRPSTYDRSNSLEISVSPFSFQNPPSSFSSLYSSKKNWFLNVSKLSIPPHIQHFLQLGDNFSLPYHNKKQIITEFIKDIENNIKKFQLYFDVCIFLIARGCIILRINYLPICNLFGIIRQSF